VSSTPTMALGLLGDHTDHEFFAGQVGTGKLDSLCGVDLVQISGGRCGQREVRVSSATVPCATSPDTRRGAS